MGETRTCPGVAKFLSESSLSTSIKGAKVSGQIWEMVSIGGMFKETVVYI